MSTHYGFVPPFSAGLRCRCPRCGEGKLYDGFLKIADRCDVCGLQLAHEDAGDGPAVFVILIYGFVMAVFAAYVELSYEPPFWVHAVIFVPLILGGSALLLRPFKAVMVALQFKHRVAGFENEPGGQ
ncbi:MAG: DUF983 domain-containing protein [Alphaproteobacteria bacterium]|nr:DUF983 domain-containing protein [Rhodospirillaceae bacterium]MDG2482186.1 DUF983 domain-containing protein [Alphaproteobacteria bacterium]MBT6203810.1 DUF983 domain-containing protein [Rhodospirillaceae bacterium]MBT6509550.1 DUF983 domain-containing protein [Rhodospirillaceae bacterium]MBT7615147.1 DUF983 domain-containing protein [Rhodospirillaceae bacterium]